MTRSEHMRWAKDRALKYVKNGDLQGAFTSMASDVTKHPETQHHEQTNQLGMTLLMDGMLNTPDQMEEWITGYN